MKEKSPTIILMAISMLTIDKEGDFEKKSSSDLGQVQINREGGGISLVKRWETRSKVTLTVSEDQWYLFDEIPHESIVRVAGAITLQTPWKGIIHIDRIEIIQLPQS